MANDFPSEEQLHRWRSDAFVDALLYGQPKDVIDCLRKLDRLDGEPFRVLVEQLEGKMPSKPKFRNRFRIVGTPGRQPHPMSEPAGERSVRYWFRRWRAEGLLYKNAIFKAEKHFGMKRSAIAAVCNDLEDPA